MKNERSLLNFQDLLLNTANLLKTNPEVRKYFQGKYHCLLVDEFQDTDPIQAEIMFYLTSENHQEKNWTKCKPHPGSLFVVGDPKQAIYRFRRADMDTYNRVKQLITAHGGEVLQLTMNFRTVSQVTTELNKLFIEQLPEKETVYQAAYRPLNSYHEDCPELVTGIKSLAIPSDFSKKDEVVLEDGKNIAKCIYYLLENGYQPRDFMVLTRYNDGLTVYSDCLEDLGIPVSVSGEVTIGEMKEFKELAALLEVFVDLTDEVAIVAALRGLFFGISDDELYRWKAAGGNFSIYANPPVDMDEVVIEKFQLAWKKLQKYNKWIRNYSPGTAIEMILEDVGFYPLLIVRQHGTRAYKALLQILSAVRAKEESGSVGYKRIYELINDLIFEKTVVVNLEDDVNAVRIMNIHKAKGLEAPVVFMAHPMKKVSPENFLSMHIKREDIHSKGYFLFKIQKGRQTKVLAIPPEWDTVRQEELRYLTEEEFRIGYVAATRAEKAMIISSSLKNNNKNPWSDILRLDAIESVSIPEMEYKERKKGESFVTFQEYKGVTGNLYDWIEAVKVKSYDTWNPTENKDYQVLTMERESGGGMDWGSVIHDVLEQVVKGSVTSPYVSNTLQKYNQPISREEEVFQYISIFKESSIWEELEQSEEVLTEVPFSLLINSEDNLYQMVKSSDEDSEPRIVKGVIDLAYKREGKWKIVDYKTDRVKTRDDLEQLTVFYQDQVDFYKQVWTRLTGEGVAEAALFFFQKQAIK
ncbi:MAG: UvrD-helicase domain-containing protein [Bacillus sp. (in: Bacteria)]|nr:UvrD-helicase domain-containing protein [Bacillus sp. (in: firmicutes)]